MALRRSRRWRRAETRFVFAALAGVRLAADAVHGDGQRLVRFLADGAERHRAGGEPLDDLLGRLDFFERHRLRRRLELQQAAQRAELPCSACRSGSCIPGMSVKLVLPHGVLQLADRQRIQQVILAAHAVLVIAADVSSVSESVSGWKA